MSLRGAVVVALGSLALVACGKSASTPTPDAPLPDPRTAAADPTSDTSADPPPAPVASAAIVDAAAPSVVDAAAVPATAERNGPVLDDADAVARAARVANVALQKAYADFVKKSQVAPSHSGPWVGAATEVRGNSKAGWDVTFRHTPPAGFSHEAMVHVTPRGELTVKKAHADFSSD